jgi:phage terminase large subunit-like protein
VATICGGQDNKVTAAPLCGLFEVYDTEIRFADGRPGRIFRIAAAAGTNEGGGPTLFVCDELHEWGGPGSRRARVCTVVAKSRTKRRTAHGCGRVIYLSTAGFDIDDSLLGEQCKRGERTRHNPAADPRYLFDWRAAPDGLDYADAAARARAVRAASAAADVLWSVTDRVADWGKPQFPPHEWIRYYANRWVDVPEDSWLKDRPGAWSACEGTWEPDPGNPFVIAVDMALRHDSVAVDRIELLPDGRTAVSTRIWTAAPDAPIDHLDVFGHVRQIAVGPGFRGVVYDPRFFEVPARLLEDSGILVIQFDQTPQRMAPACGLAYELIVNSKVVHDGDPQLARHVKSAAKREQDRGFTLSKGRSKGHIDAAVAMCMGVWVLHEVPEPVLVAVTARAAAPADTGSFFRPSSRLTI